MLTMHALDWLNERGCILQGAIQPIECILFALWSLSFSLSLQCDLALSLGCCLHLLTNFDFNFFSNKLVGTVS